TSRRRHTRFSRDWSSDVCSSDLGNPDEVFRARMPVFAATPIEGDPALAGVRVDEVRQSEAAPLRRYEPGHPLADAQGYVYAPDKIGRASCRERAYVWAGGRAVAR